MHLKKRFIRRIILKSEFKTTYLFREVLYVRFTGRSIVTHVSQEVLKSAFQHRTGQAMNLSEKPLTQNTTSLKVPAAKKTKNSNVIVRSIPPVAGSAAADRLLKREPDLQVSSESGGNEVEILPPPLLFPSPSSTIPSFYYFFPLRERMKIVFF